MFFQEEVTAEESTDGEVEAQTYNQDSQDSIGEVSMLEKKNIFSRNSSLFYFTINVFRNEISNHIWNFSSGNHFKPF